MTSIWRGLECAPRLLGNAKTAFTGAMLATALLSACGGGGGGSSPPVVAAAPTVPTGLSMGYDVKAFKLSWAAVTPPADGGAVTYRVTEDPDGAGPQAATQIATDLTTTSYTQQVTGLLTTRLNATYTVQACNSLGCSALATPVTVDVKQAIGYFKATRTGEQDFFGSGVALSADGSTLAVGAKREGSSATGINGDYTDNAATGAGAVYVFTRSAGIWSQQAYIKASNTKFAAGFGNSVALSADGNTLAVGASSESSNAKGINGDQTNDAAYISGAVYVFNRSGATWSQQAYVKASNTDASDSFGNMVALSADGATLAVGAVYEASNATGINGDQTNNAAPNAGAVYVFTRSLGVWSQQAYVKASNAGAGDRFGGSLALSADGTILAVGAANESSNATGINGDQTNNAAYAAGAVYVFARSGTNWSQQAYIKAGDTEAQAYFGNSVALSADGSTLAVGSIGGGNLVIDRQGNLQNAALPRGAVYVFTRSAGAWSQQFHFKPNIISSHIYPFSWGFGSSVALSADGITLAVGAVGDASNAIGINGDQTNNLASGSGAVYMFTRSGITWSQQAYVKASNTRANGGGGFGGNVALSADGTTMAVGATEEAGMATGVNGYQNDTSMPGAGAVYLY